MTIPTATGPTVLQTFMRLMNEITQPLACALSLIPFLISSISTTFGLFASVGMSLEAVTSQRTIKMIMQLLFGIKLSHNVEY